MSHETKVVEVIGFFLSLEYFELRLLVPKCSSFDCLLSVAVRESQYTGKGLKNRSSLGRDVTQCLNSRIYKK